MNGYVPTIALHALEPKWLQRPGARLLSTTYLERDCFALVDALLVILTVVILKFDQNFSKFTLGYIKTNLCEAVSL